MGSSDTDKSEKGSYPFPIPSPNGMVVEASGNTLGSADADSKHPEVKEKFPVKRLKGSLGSLDMITGKTTDESETIGTSANSTCSKKYEDSYNSSFSDFSFLGFQGNSFHSAESGSDGSSDGSDANSHNDERELKRQKRKQSNRESARRSRLRNQHAEVLKEENASLRAELNRIRSDYDQLLTENATLKERLGEGPEDLESCRADLRVVNEVQESVKKDQVLSSCSDSTDQSRERYVSRLEFESFKESMKQDLKADMKSMIEDFTANMTQIVMSNVLHALRSFGISVPEGTYIPLMTPLDSHPSAHHTSDSFTKFDEIRSCFMTVQHDGHELIVAKGKVYPRRAGDRLQHIRIYVEVVGVGMSEIPLPSPTDEHVYVGDVHGTSCQWPLALVIFDIHGLRYQEAEIRFNYQRPPSSGQQVEKIREIEIKPEQRGGPQ